MCKDKKINSIHNVVKYTKRVLFTDFYFTNPGCRPCSKS